MKQWLVPSNSTWMGNADFFYVCFNDDCPYYLKGWDWMQSQYQVTASYRCKMDPLSGKTSPLPVWSQDALKNQVLPDEE